MTDVEKSPTRGERILAAVVAFTLWMAVIFAIVAIFVGWRWSLRMFVGVLLIGIPGEIVMELVGRGPLLPSGASRIRRSRGSRLLLSALNPYRVGVHRSRGDCAHSALVRRYR